jgi:hypothetical protein
MDLVILFGPQAVGKMTVGEELQKLTGLKLFHNHMTIDLVLKFFTWEEGQDLIHTFRNEIMKKMASSSNQRGMIFTYVWAFNSEDDWTYINHVCDIFKEHNIYFVELNADMETRLHRNSSENRLEKKWTKRDVNWSNQELVKSLDKYRLISREGEIPYRNYLRIENTNITANEAANIIVNCFDLDTI